MYWLFKCYFISVESSNEYHNFQFTMTLSPYAEVQNILLPFYYVDGPFFYEYIGLLHYMFIEVIL